MELFEARVPKGMAVVCEIDGIAEIVRDPDGSRKIVVRKDLEDAEPTVADLTKAENKED